MTALRSQLRFARQAYRSAQYPGDLAAELLPNAKWGSEPSPSRRWLLFTGVASSAAAAAVMLGLLMSRVSDLPRPWHGDPSQRALVDWIPIAPERFPVPKFQSPGLPSPVLPELRLQVPGTIERCRDLALPYPNLKPALPNVDLNFDLPPLPELPSRSVEWLRKAWHSIESA